MIDTKEAIEQAKKYFKDVYDGTISRLRVEEIELDEDEDYFTNVLGWDEPRELTPVELMIKNRFAPPPKKRYYKTFLVDSNNGKVKKMIIWERYDD
ncbi:hypothetical protein SDC9_08477 [bioreactor metagenome]|uniref:Uncharacterized protein n=1 Tax=bioreactor metagenome TaxID=1076179 RepID=A0A644T8Q3_9ZZZZ|nr:hypothetical protein [Methanobrevibacter sp.]MEA4957220.1 hypothetical protein [Methanobrevibacter sp.]